jgi:tetratricopeptide (TPR) repeat protein
MKSKMAFAVAVSIIMISHSQFDISCAAADNTTALNKGMSLYNAGKYQQALPLLNSAVKQSPAEPLAHYYLANCYMAMKQAAKAKSHYQQVVNVAPYSTCAQYAQMALDNMPGNNSNRTIATPATSIDPDTAISRMKMQAEEATRRNSDVFKDLSGRANTQIEAKIKQLKTEEEERIKAVPETILGGRPNPEYQPSVDAIKADVKARLEELNKKRDSQKSTYDKATNQRSNSYDAMVDNLKSQMDNSGRSGVRLKPEGTNIYIRNYGQ